MADDTILVSAALYHLQRDAWQDHREVDYLHTQGVPGSDHAAIVTKEDHVTVQVSKGEKTTRREAWTGVGVGAVAGVLFPPALIGTVAAGRD